MIEWIKRNGISCIAIFLAIGAICLSAIRIDPIDFNNGSMVSFVVGLMGICATIMVASQIMGLRFSETQVRSMLNKEADKLRKESYNSMIAGLFEVEVLAAINSYERQEWKRFMTDIDLLISYVSDLGESQKANRVAKILIEAEISFRFYEHLLEDGKKHIHDNVWKLTKIMDDKPNDLFTLFKVLKATQ